MQRRDFLRRLGLTTAAAVAAPMAINAIAEKQDVQPDLRHLGATSINPDHITKITQEPNGKWGSVYSMELEPKVWEEWYKAYDKGFSIFDLMTLPKT